MIPVKRSNLQESLEDLRATVIPQADRVQVLRPQDNLPLHVDAEFRARSSQQESLYDAKAEDEARTGEVSAAKVSFEANAAKTRMAVAAAVADDAAAIYGAALRALLPHIRRKRGQVLFFRLRTTALVLGDWAGLASALVLLGDIPELAMAQATAAAASVVTAGLLGAELKNLRASKKRAIDPGELTQDQAVFRSLFSVEDKGGRIAKVVLVSSLLVGSVVAAGIMALRAELDGLLSGFVFAGFAVGVAFASYVSSYVHADEVADTLAAAEGKYHRLTKLAAQLAAAPSISRFEGHLAHSSAARRHAKAQGAAASLLIEAELQGIRRRNPGVAGHGPADEVIGRRHRDGEDIR